MPRSRAWRETGALVRLGAKVWTTSSLAACEASLLRAADRPQEREWVSPAAFNAALAAAPHLTPEQAEAVREAGRNDGVAILEAGAETGKTTTAKVIVDAARRAGLNVIALAPNWVAADELTKSTGVKSPSPNGVSTAPALRVLCSTRKRSFWSTRRE